MKIPHSRHIHSPQAPSRLSWVPAMSSLLAIRLFLRSTPLLSRCNKASSSGSPKSSMIRAPESDCTGCLAGQQIFVAGRHKPLGAGTSLVNESMTSLGGWENFYVIVGSAAGALIGLQFVVVTLIAD